ncbi:MAG: hypothetical protein QOI24_2760 [Acidobacteriota bacterium]|jgi:hypothetical protein|nr:hypothetical protein [Acidobacteriota bacterium]
MTRMKTKEILLKEAGYRYNFDRMAYVNQREKKVFAEETVEDQTPEWLAERIAEPNVTGDWQFYEEPSVAVRRAFVAELENGRSAHR